MYKCTLIFVYNPGQKVWDTSLFSRVFLYGICNRQFTFTNTTLQAFSLPGTGFEVYNLLACEAQPYFR